MSYLVLNSKDKFSYDTSQILPVESPVEWLVLTDLVSQISGCHFLSQTASLIGCSPLTGSPMSHQFFLTGYP